MDRIKTLFKYVVCLILLYIISNILIWGLLRVSYKEIKDYNIDVSIAKVTIKETKVTSRNGYIKGEINNITDQEITNKYFKIELYSKRDVLLGTQYIKIENMKAYQIYEFEVDFKIPKVEKFNITVTDYMELEKEAKLDDIVDIIIKLFPIENELQYPTNNK